MKDFVSEPNSGKKSFVANVACTSSQHLRKNTSCWCYTQIKSLSLTTSLLALFQHFSAVLSQQFFLCVLPTICPLCCLNISFLLCCAKIFSAVLSQHFFPSVLCQQYLHCNVLTFLCLHCANIIFAVLSWEKLCCRTVMVTRNSYRESVMITVKMLFSETSTNKRLCKVNCNDYSTIALPSKQLKFRSLCNQSKQVKGETWMQIL